MPVKMQYLAIILLLTGLFFFSVQYMPIWAMVVLGCFTLMGWIAFLQKIAKPRRRR